MTLPVNTGPLPHLCMFPTLMYTGKPMAVYMKDDRTNAQIAALVHKPSPTQDHTQAVALIYPQSVS